MRPDSLTMLNIMSIYFEGSKPALHIIINWWIIGILLITIIIGILIAFINRKTSFRLYEVIFEFSGTPKATFKIQRNTENLFIANRILIDMTTRKAALPFDEQNDVIIEVYDSWYKLFGIIRDEIKTLPGHYLVNHDPTTALIGLTKRILNDALRPHLTEHQARFRKWFKSEEQNQDNLKLSPQELQRKYPDYDNLVKSLKDVNTCLITFADELDLIIRGK